MVVSFDGNAFLLSSGQLPIDEVMALDFNISFKRPSTLTLVAKNHCYKVRLYFLLLAHCAAAAVLIPLLIYLANYIILTEMILCLVAAYFLVPQYFAFWAALNKEGVQVHSFEDPADLVQLQKSVFAHYRGKKLLKRGLIESKFIEEVCYCILPNKWFNSDYFRDWVKFLGEVIYPIVVIVCPLLLTVLYLIGPVISQLQTWFNKDYFVRFVLRTAEYIGDEAEDQMGRYWITKLLLRYYAVVWGWYYYVLILLMSWLQSEVALFLMKIDYMQDRYMRVFKTVKAIYYSVRRVVFGFLNVVFYPAIKAYQGTVGRYRHVVEATKPEVFLNAYEKSKKLNDEVSKVAAIAKEVVPDLHPKTE